NPLPLFYQGRGTGMSDDHLRDAVQLANPEELATKTAQAEQKPMGGRMQKDGHALARASGAAPPPPPSAAPAPEPAKPMSVAAEKAEIAANANEAPKPIAVRTDFRALALFAPRVATDARGRAEVAVKLPDNLTRYRVMAIAVAGEKQFGAGESVLTARLPLMVRPSPPRFLNFGDKFELPVVLQNQTDAPMDVDVAARVVNLELVAGAGRRAAAEAAH